MSIYKGLRLRIPVTNIFLWVVDGFFPTWRFISAKVGAFGSYGGLSSSCLGLGCGSTHLLTIRTHHIPLEILEVIITHSGDGGFIRKGEVRIRNIYRLQVLSQISQNV